ncbi:MAG: aldo/keto reductase [Burkholderiales bacterium]|jgi:aryl-alcohol dehydrogenase-like predicted oxidoreductase|nr:aldo/keto reductase [Burkholderiales bacterium]
MKRRALLKSLPALAGTALLPAAAQPAPLRRTIPASGERINAIGLGTWLTFDVGDQVVQRTRRQQVLQAFFAAGGGMIDSSPMYGRAERLLGELLPQVKHAGRLFSATKVWTAFGRIGPAQMTESLRLWGSGADGRVAGREPRRFDLMQVHNLLNWPEHLKTLRAWKDTGRFRYIGVTTSHGSRHDEMRRLLSSEPVDFMQITLNLADRSALPLIELAASRGVAVIVNRPFDGGLLFNRVGERPLPEAARETGCTGWAQACLKWILAHPAVTCAIPATTNPAHATENMGALLGPLPDAAQQRRIAAAFDAL